MSSAGHQEKVMNAEGRVVSREKRSQDRMVMSVPKASLPKNTVPGNFPIIVPIKFQIIKDIDSVIAELIEKYFQDPSEPVVVLVIANKRMRKLKKFASEEDMTLWKRKVTYYFPNSEKFSADDIVNLKEFLTHPEGVLITDAEAFGGMQARNIVVVGDSSKAVRNYILRAISQVIIIRNYNQMDKYIDANPNVIVDKQFLSTDLQKVVTLRPKSSAVWLWHLPYGTTEEDIRQHLKKQEQEQNVHEISKLFSEDSFNGYRLILDRSILQKFIHSSNHFWPPGWGARRLGFHPTQQKPQKKSNMCPDKFNLMGAKAADDIVGFVEKSGFSLCAVSPDCRTSRDSHWIVKVEKEDYVKLIQPEFWKPTGWRVTALM